MSTLDSFTLGDVTITRVVEWSGAIRTTREILPDSPPAAWRQHRAELAPDFWDPDDDAYLCTPGSSVLQVRSGGDRAVLVGDLLHSPVQFFEPHANSCFCEDPQEARRTCLRVLSESADTRTLVIPAHFPGHGAAEVRRDGDAFAIRRWAPIGRIEPTDGQRSAT